MQALRALQAAGTAGFAEREVLLDIPALMLYSKLFKALLTLY